MNLFRNRKFMTLAIGLLACYWFSSEPWGKQLYKDDDKLVHAVAFFLMYGGFYWALRWRPGHILLTLVLVGGGIELHQLLFLPNSTASFSDWIADLAGLIPATIAHKLKIYTRRLSVALQD